MALVMWAWMYFSSFLSRMFVSEICIIWFPSCTCAASSTVNRWSLVWLGWIKYSSWASIVVAFRPFWISMMQGFSQCNFYHRYNIFRVQLILFLLSLCQLLCLFHATFLMWIHCRKKNWLDPESTNRVLLLFCLHFFFPVGRITKSSSTSRLNRFIRWFIGASTTSKVKSPFY